MFYSISPEDKFIITCLQNKTKELNFAVNEEQLLHRLKYHKLTSMVYQTLLQSNCLGNLSLASQTLLKEHYKVNIVQNIAVNYLIHKISSTFYKNNIDIIVLKGAMLIHEFPEYAAVREMRDVDILVRRRDLESALRILKKHEFDISGFTEKFNNKRQQWFALNLSNAFPVMPDGKAFPSIMLEIHHRLFSCLNKTYWSEKSLWERVVFCTEQKVFYLELVDAILHMCAHQCSDLQIYLSGFMDIAYILNFHSEKIDWMKVIERAKYRKMLLHLINILRITHEITDISLPQVYHVFLKPYEAAAESGYRLLLQRLFNQELRENIADTIKISKTFRHLEYTNPWQRFFLELQLAIPLPIYLEFGYYFDKIFKNNWM